MMIALCVLMSMQSRDCTGQATMPGQPEVAFGVGGVPRPIAQTRDYDKIFGQLSAAGATVFFPTFQYREAPAPATLGFEVDFLAPCNGASAAFTALKKNKLRLLLVGDLIYPRAGAFPAMASDPLKALIACAGREQIYGVLTYDEPVHNGIDDGALKAVYERIKQIDATLPVLMVHAPIVLDREPHLTASGRAGYLDNVVRASRYADIVGFDIYPIPPSIAKIGSPASEGRIVGHAEAIRDYSDWLKQRVPDKKHWVVLQGFSYADQFSPMMVAFMRRVMDLTAVRHPTAAELREMAEIAIAGDAVIVMWWGPSLLTDSGLPMWQSLLDTIRGLRKAR